MILSRRLLLGAALTLSACGARSNREQIAVSFHNLAEPFFVVMRRELMDEAETLGVDVNVLDGQANSAKQTADVETALVQGVDGIILAPTDVNALTPAVDRVLQEGTPIVTVDRRVEGAASEVAHIGADNVAGGRLLAEWVIGRFPNGARIVVLSGQPGSSSGIDRTRGIRERFTEAGAAYVIVAEQTANWSRDQGLTVTQNILTSLGARVPDVIVAENDDMAFGALEALRTANLSIPVLGFDATPEALRRIRAGEMSATVEQSPSRQIRTALQQVVARIRGQGELSSVSVMPVLITAENLDNAERIAEAQ